MFTAHITAARIPASIIYVQVTARQHLRNGPTRVHLPAPSNTLFTATVEPRNGIACTVLHCPPLYGHHATDPILPLQLGDVVDYDVRNGELFIKAIRRNGGAADFPPATIPVGGRPAPAGVKPEKKPVALAAPDPASDFDVCFSLHRLPQLPPYLAANAGRIHGLSPQVLPEWDRSYGNIDHTVMGRLRRQFPERRISREALVERYACWNDPVLCLVATMVWGGIDAKRDNEKKVKVSHLRALLATSEGDLLGVMNRLRALIRAGALESAFSACHYGALKLPGVGSSFFTKLFFFLGQVPPVLNPAPLILDKWTAHAFCILGAQACPSPRWSKMFDLKPLHNPKPDAVELRPSIAAELYRPYVAWMNYWAQMICVPAGLLEQFVFGVSRKDKSGKSGTNPRNELIQLGRDLFPNP